MRRTNLWRVNDCLCVYWELSGGKNFNISFKHTKPHIRFYLYSQLK